MVRTDLPYTYIAKGRYWRFRHPLTGDCGLPGRPCDAEFHAKYSELISRVERGKVPLDRSTFRWLVKRYKASAEFRSLKDPTQVDYTRTLDLIDEKLGDQPFRLTTRKMIKAVRDDYAETPRKAHKIKQMVSRLYSWADENDLVPAGFNPAAAIKRIKPKGGAKEITVWSEAEITAYLAIAKPHEATPMMLALYTGQRREDIARMTWQQFQGDIIRVRQSKTGELLDVGCHPALRNYLANLPRKAVTIATNANGLPYSADAMAGAIRRAVARADMADDRSIHGLRYAAGSRLEEAGCNIGDIQSVLGHRTYQMAVKYSTQRKRSLAAVARVQHKG